MNGLEHADSCPRCGSHALKPWSKLTDDERFVAQRQPASAEYTPEQRKTHRICTRCWFEETMQTERRA